MSCWTHFLLHCEMIIQRHFLHSCQHALIRVHCKTSPLNTLFQSWLAGKLYIKKCITTGFLINFEIETSRDWWNAWCLWRKSHLFKKLFKHILPPMAMEMRVTHLFQMYMHVHLNFSQKIKISIINYNWTLKLFQKKRFLSPSLEMCSLNYGKTTHTKFFLKKIVVNYFTLKSNFFLSNGNLPKTQRAWTRAISGLWTR